MRRTDKDKFMAIIADLQTGRMPKVSFQEQASSNEDSNDMAAVLTEDMVTDSLENHLTANGWRIISRAKGKVRGVDVVAERRGTRMEIEAKGAGSGDPTTKNYGLEFTRGNVFTHVGEAVLKALRVITVGQAQAAIALPDNYDHRSEIELVRVVLWRLGIVVFWVRQDGAVSTEGDFPVERRANTH
jgi:hypothetical protein